MTATTQSKARRVLGEATVGELQASVRGDVVRPGDANYDEARAIWNGSHDKYPALIIKASGTADVIKAIEFVCSQDLPLAVRGLGCLPIDLEATYMEARQRGRIG